MANTKGQWPELLYWETCPKCGAVGRIDREQLEGDVSIICSRCEYHYHRNP